MVGILGVSWEAAVLAVCLPPIFVHVHWQPGISIGFGSTTVNAYLSDFAVFVVGLVAIVAAARRGLAPLRPGRVLWVSLVALLAWIVVEVALGRSRSAAYPWHTHAVTAAKYIEYALLAASLPLVVRRRRDLLAPLWSLTLWSGLASLVGLGQFAGVHVFDAASAGSRQGSFVGTSDLAALSGAVLLTGIVALVVPEVQLGRRLGITAIAAGAVGVFLAGAVASVLGLVTAAVLLSAVLLRERRLPERRALAAGSAAVLAAVGVLIFRGGDIGSFSHFLRSSPASPQAKEKTVQTYAHHTLLAWIGLQIWKDHPVLGAGWEASQDPATFERYLPAAHRRFPNEPSGAFPSRARIYGVQNMWVQGLADLGLVGIALLVSSFAAVVAVAWRASRGLGRTPALIGLGCTGLVAWLWASQSFVAGIPLDAVTWLAFGLVGTGAAWTADAAGRAEAE